MKTKKEYGKKKVSGKKYNSRLKNKKRSQMININNLNGGSRISLKTQKSRIVPPSIHKLNVNELSVSFRPVTKAVKQPPKALKKKSHNYIPPDSMFKPGNYTTDPYRDLSLDEAKLRSKMNINNMKIIDNTDLSLSLYHQINKDIYSYNVNEIELSVSLLQNAINNKFITESNNMFLQFNTIPSLILTKEYYAKHTHGSNDDFINVYEDEELIPYEKCIENFYKKQYNCKIKIYNDNRNDETIQHIEYVLRIADTLNKHIPNIIDNECNLSGIPKEYIILENIECIEDNTTYTICGYPSLSMRYYFSILKQHEEKIKNIYEDHKINFNKYMCAMYNFLPEHINKIKDDKLELYKLNDKNTSFYRKYVLNFFKEKYDEHKYKEIEKIYNEMIQDLNNKILNEYLNKPLINIEYVFIIFKKDKDNKFIPGFFNFRELKSYHINIIKKIKELININIPLLFNITNNVTDKYNLFFSYHKYGDFFHIKTEYIHTMSNIFKYANKFKDIITLEELIYMLSLSLDKNLNLLRIDYKVKKYRLEFIKTKLTDINFDSKDKCNYSYQKHNNKNDNKDILPLNTFLEPNKTKILLMYKEFSNKYKFIYENNNLFYSIVIETNLCNITYKIIDTILNKINSFLNKDKKDYKKDNDIEEIYSCIYTNIYTIITPEINMFKIITHKILNMNEYNEIMLYNPVIIFKRNRSSYDINIKFNQLFISNMFSITDKNHSNSNKNDLNIINPYMYKPFIIRNILASNIYIDENKKFQNKLKLNKESQHIYYAISETEDKINTEKDNKYLYELLENNNMIINRIYFNPNNCRYNFIELYSGKLKKVVWVVPIQSTSYEHINEEELFNNDFIMDKPIFIRNFTDLNNNHINMLTEFKNIYSSKYYCELNTQTTQPLFNCMHIHLLNNKETYKNDLTKNKGSRSILQLSIQTILNNLDFNNNYYNKYDLDILGILNRNL